MALPTAEFEAWLKASDNMKLSANRTVARLIAEGITDFDSLVDFDKKSIEYLPKTVKETIPRSLRMLEPVLRLNVLSLVLS